MSPVEVDVILEYDDVNVTVDTSPTPLNVVLVGDMGPPGPPGPQGQWVAMTQAEYDALTEVDPDTLYVIVS